MWGGVTSVLSVAATTNTAVTEMMLAGTKVMPTPTDAKASAEAVADFTLDWSLNPQDGEFSKDEICRYSTVINAAKVTGNRRDLSHRHPSAGATSLRIVSSTWAQ
jgi:hypothetical protein